MARNDNTTDELKAELGAAAREATETARAKGEELASKVQDFAHTARNKASEAASTARDKASEAASTARELGSEYAEVARDEARRLYREGERRAGEIRAHADEYYDDVSGMVRRHPAQALGIAAGIGFLVGLMIARR